MRIISFIDQPEVIKKILQHLGLWEKSHAPPGRMFAGPASSKVAGDNFEFSVDDPPKQIFIISFCEIDSDISVN